jgi:eukaryotic-like serine/threonine-protein kinase
MTRGGIRMTAQQGDERRAGLNDWLRDDAAPTIDERPDATSVRIQNSEVMGRFELMGALGRGGMGHVCLVRDRALNREAAMKILDPEFSTRPGSRDAFIEEAQIASQLEHPNVVPVHELGADEAGTVYFTMKVVRGKDLFDWSRNPAIPPGSMERLSEGLEIFTKVCDAVAYAHSLGVIHRDIKPSNVMVGGFGEVYLVDWGLARVKPDQGEPETPSQRRIVLGTAAYMPPEQALGHSAVADERSDIFGLGALLYHIVTGCAPYPGKQRAATVAAQRTNYVPTIKALGDARVSKRLVRIIEKAMHADPNERFASAQQLKRAVQRFLRGGLYLPRRAFPAGSAILEEGQPGEEAFIVVSGNCEAYRLIDGERQVLRTMGPGDVFGEMAILTQTTRTASVDAVDNVTVLVISAATMSEEFGEGSWIGKLLVSLAGRFGDLDEQLVRERSND